MSYSINSTNQQLSSEDFEFNLGPAIQEDLQIPLSSELNSNIKCGKTPKMKAPKKGETKKANIVESQRKASTPKRSLTPKRFSIQSKPSAGTKAVMSLIDYLPQQCDYKLYLDN